MTLEHSDDRSSNPTTNLSMQDLIERGSQSSRE